MVKLAIVGPQGTQGSISPYLNIIEPDLAADGWTTRRFGFHSTPFTKTCEGWRPLPLSTIVAEVRKLAEEIAAWHPDVIALHAGNLERELFLPPLMLDQNTPLIAHVHALRPTLVHEWLRTDSREALELLSSGPRPSGSVFYSGRALRQWEAHNTPTTSPALLLKLPSTIPSTCEPADAEWIEHLAQGRRVASLIGFGTPWKDLSLLRTAVSSQEGANLLVLVCGPDWVFPQGAIRNVQGLDAPVSLENFRNGSSLAVVPTYFEASERLAVVQASAVGVFPYRHHDSFQGSGSIADYLANGRPCLASDVGNFSEYGPECIILGSAPADWSAAFEDLPQASSAPRSADFAPRQHARSLSRFYQAVHSADAC